MRWNPFSAREQAQTTPTTTPPTLSTNGRILHTDGPLVDAQFDPAHLPAMYSALTITDPLRKLTVTVSVAQIAPNGVVRCIQLASPVALTSGLEVVDTDGPSALHSPIDSLRQAMSIFNRDRYTAPTMLETGIKAIDLLCPIPRGGKVGVFAEWGAGALVVVPEIVRQLQGQSVNLSLYTMLDLTPYAPRWKESMTETISSAGEIQTIYLTVGEPTAPAVHAQFDTLDAVLPLTRRLSKQGIYPSIDSQTCSSQLLDQNRVDREHYETAQSVRQLLRRALELGSSDDPSGWASLSVPDQTLVARARKIERFLSQPFYVAEPYTGMKGRSVPCAETIRGCQALLAGQYDDWPERAFYMIGGIEEAANYPPPSST